MHNYRLYLPAYFLPLYKRCLHPIRGKLPNGGRVYQRFAQKTIEAWDGFDGTDLIAKYDGSNALLRRYVHGPGVDEPLVWYEGTGTGFAMLGFLFVVIKEWNLLLQKLK